MNNNQSNQIPQGIITIAEFSSIVFPAAVGKEQSSLRFRLVKKNAPIGKPVIHFDIREFEVTQEEAKFTKKGVYFTVDHIDTVIQNLLKAKEVINGTDYGSRGKDSSVNPD